MEKQENNNTLLRPIQEFMHTESSSGIILVVATLLALLVANTGLNGGYQAWLNSYITVGAGGLLIDKLVILWINDGLMTIFFLLIGLEIKRELLYGELSTTRKAMMPLFAAFGGAIVPGLIYFAVNSGTQYIDGWAIAIATDIAFAIGILALLGKKVPLWAKVLLTATAVVDDLIAVIVIAVFYTSSISMSALAVAGFCIIILVIFNKMNVLKLSPYIIVGIIMWVAVLKSGVHATIAGVVLGFIIPSIKGMKSNNLIELATKGMQQFKEAFLGDDDELKEVAKQKLEKVVHNSESPLHRLEHSLHPWVSFGVMPIFAFANAGVVLSMDTLSIAFESTLTWGIIAGLFIGKQVGIFGAAWALTITGFSGFPKTLTTWKILYGVGCLSGIGFTMSLFITGLAFTDSDIVELSKIGILTGSLISGIVGYTILHLAGTRLLRETETDTVA